MELGQGVQGDIFRKVGGALAQEVVEGFGNVQTLHKKYYYYFIKDYDIDDLLKIFGWYTKCINK